MNKDAVKEIQHYIKQRYSRIPVMWNKDLFRQWSYGKTVSYYILNLVKNENQLPAKIVIEDFIRNLDNWSCENRHTSRMFSAAYDAAVDIMDMFL